jgi:hypothetical protein
MAAMAGVVAVAALVPTPSPPRTMAARSAVGVVNLSFRIDSATAPREGTVVQRLHVRAGDGGFTGTAAVTYVTPMYVNIDHTKPLPVGCAMRLDEPDPTIPEVVTCRVAERLDVGGEFTLDMPLVVTSLARFTGRTRGMAMVAPVAGSGVTDVNLSDNWEFAQLRVLPPAPVTPPGRPVDFYVTHQVPALMGGVPGAVTFQYGNKGPKIDGGGTHLTFVTPFYVNHHGVLPPGCAMRLTDGDPLVPEIVTCTLSPLPPGLTRSVAIPVTLVANAPEGQIGGLGLVAPATAERDGATETWQIDNFVVVNALNITPPAHQKPS